MVHDPLRVKTKTCSNKIIKNRRRDLALLNAICVLCCILDVVLCNYFLLPPAWFQILVERGGNDQTTEHRRTKLGNVRVGNKLVNWLARSHQ